MKTNYSIFILIVFFSITGWSQGQLHPFKDDVEQQADFEQDNLVGWTSLDLDGYNTAGSFHNFPGKGGPLGFIVYNPSQTDPVNVLEGYEPYSGQKYFASISSYDGPINDWLISDELADHPGGVLSFYAKSSFDYAGPDKFKVGYSTAGADPEDFIFIGNTITPSTNWAKFEFVIPADAKHLAINAISEAVMLLIDDIQFEHDIDPLAPGLITDFTMNSVLGNDIEVSLDWVNPTIDFAGNALDELIGVKVFRGTHPMNLTEIADLTSTVGESMTYEDLLPEGGSYIYRLVPYNTYGNGKIFTTPLTFFGYETIPGAPKNITFTQNGSLQTVISWDEVDYGVLGGTLENPVVGYTLTRSLGSTTETLAEMHSSTTYTETEIPDLNLYTYSLVAQTSPEDYGVPAEVSAYSGLSANQESVTSGNKASEQAFELSRSSIISQSIYTPEEIGSSGLITAISYFGNLGTTTSARYKIYMSTTNRDIFGTNLNNAIWEYFGDQKLLFDGTIEFPAGRNAINIDLDQPFYYDETSGENVIITIVKPLLENPPTVNPRDFYNTSVDGMRTYYAIGYSVDLSLISTQPASWSTEEVPTIPSVVVEKRKNYGSLAGIVTQLSDGTPLEDVTVTIIPEDSGTYQIETTTTDEDGVYNIPALLPGSYLATFSKDTFDTYETSIVIEPNEQLILDVQLDSSVPLMISGTVVDAAGDGIEGASLSLSGFSNFSTESDANGSFTLEAFAEKEYDLEIFHPLYNIASLSFISEEDDYTLDPISLNLSAHKPINVIAVNNNGIGEVSWSKPVGHFNETILGWGSFDRAGDKWGNGGNPFIAGIRFEASDLQAQVAEDAELTHVRAFIANNAEIIIKVFEGENAAQLIHEQAVSISEEGWYIFELTTSLPIDVTQELWIGIEFLAGQYGAYPIGLDDGPNAPDRKGSMKYENGVWTAMSLTNKNWNIYGIANNAMEANPSGYKVYRSPASVTEWTELTSDPITTTAFNDASLNTAAPDIYKYGISALYTGELISEKAISNEVEHNMFFDFNLEVEADFGNVEGAYVSISNEDNFAEAFVPVSGSSVSFSNLARGTYDVRVELENYEIGTLSDVVVEENGAATIPLNLLKVQPSNLTATIEGSSSARLDWTLHSSFIDQMERYEDFERENIGNYELKDLDGLETHTFINFTWPNAGSPMSFMVFNPHATTPAVEFDAFSGRRFLSAIASPYGVNNDWLIIPAGSGEFSFMAASLVGADPERIRVLYSTTGSEVSDFTEFQGVINVPEVWTEYSFEAPEETKFVAINYVSNDTYILKLDNLTYQKEYDHALFYNIYLNGELVSENVTDLTFTLHDLTNETHVAEVEAVYPTGFSEKTEVIISLLDVEDHELSKFLIYPNPSNGRFSLVLQSRANVSVIDMHGRVLNTTVKEAGSSIMDYNLPSGTYIIQVESEYGTSSKRIIIL